MISELQKTRILSILNINTPIDISGRGFLIYVNKKARVKKNNQI